MRRVPVRISATAPLLSFGLSGGMYYFVSVDLYCLSLLCNHKYLMDFL